MNKRLLNQAVKVRDLLSDPANWGQSDIAVDHLGNDVSPCSKKACEFCLIGGIAAVLKINSSQGAYDQVPKHPLGVLIGNVIEGIAADESGRELDLDGICDSTLYNFNDCHTHAEVMEVLETAIAHIEGAEEAGVKV